MAISRAKKALAVVGVVIAVIAVVLVGAFLYLDSSYLRYYIPSESMSPTLEVNDEVLVNKRAYDNEDPQVGDIVTFLIADEDGSNKRTLVKRVVATGGQIVYVADGQIYVNGVALGESYVNGKETNPIDGSTVTYPYLVPDGYVWMMGDNRTNSKDSRWYGAVPIVNITGKVSLRYLPLSSFGSVE